MKTLSTSKTTWDLSTLLKGDTDPSIEEKNTILISKNRDFVDKWKNRKDYLEDPKILKEALDEYENLEAHYSSSGDVGYYFLLRSSQDQENTTIKAALKKQIDLSIKLQNEVQFFLHSLAKVSKDIQELFISSPLLVSYKHFLENLFKESIYLLDEKEEKIINILSPYSNSNWVDLTEELLSKEEVSVITEDSSVPVTTLYSELFPLLSNKKKQIRDSAATALNAIFSKNLDVAVHEINSVLGYKKAIDDLRGFSRPDFKRHFEDDMETDVIDSLLSAVEGNFDASNRFYELKSKLLNLPKLEYYERSVPYGDLDIHYSWNDTVSLVGKVFESLHPRFYSIFSDMLESGCVDVFPRKGKYVGAFNISSLKSQPTFILLNHTNKLLDVTTFAHEMGHAINAVLTAEEQNALNCLDSLGTSEVASTFMEDFVLDEISKDSKKEVRLAILMTRLDGYFNSIHRQLACYRFEQALHTKHRELGYLSGEDIGKLFMNNMSLYMGDSVLATEGSENWWIGWSHIREPFYVYSYATGALISKAMQKMVREDSKNIEKVIEFLSSGSISSPKDIFLQLGIDISDKSFWEQGLSEIQTMLTEAFDLSRELGKIS